jgi:iron complex outermembrane recepter protein
MRFAAHLRPLSLFTGMAFSVLPASAYCQSSTNVVTEAVDAFGTRIGLERIGLYSESQVRGFSLAQAANFQVDGVYIATLSTPGNPILSGVTTRVGWNALQSDLPAPSGIVDYAIASPGSGSHTYIEAGLLERKSPYLFGTVSASDRRGRWGLAGGFQALPHSRRVDGRYSRQFGAGFVAEWRPDQDTSIKAFASGSDFKSPGDWGFIATEAALPPKPDYPTNYAAIDSRTGIEQYLVGLIARTKKGSWDIHAGVFHSALDLNPVDVTLIAADRFGRGRALAIYSHRGTANAVSGEVKVGYRLNKSSRLFASLRGRETTYHTPRASVVDLGPVNLEDGIASGAAASLAPTVHTLDVIQQVEAAVGVETRFADRVLVRAAVRRAFYEKAVTPPDLPTTRQIDEPWLFNAAAILALSPTLTAFATYTRGVEESGSAPATATNRFAALPAVTATQAELGLRARLTPKLSFIASLFQVAKPTPGFDGQGAYRLVNKQRHQGAELSLTGELASGLTAVIGAAILSPKLEGERVDAGLTADRPVGVSGTLATASFSYAIAKLPGLSVDSQISYSGERLVHTNGDLRAPAFAVANLGARYSFKLGNQSAGLRLLVSNVLNASAWQAGSSQIIQRTPPRAVRITLSLRH